MNVTLVHYLILGAILFSIAVMGIFLNRRNLIFVFFILTVAASETAIGLGILMILFRKIRSVRADDMDSLKG